MRTFRNARKARHNANHVAMMYREHPLRLLWLVLSACLVWAMFGIPGSSTTTSQVQPTAAVALKAPVDLVVPALHATQSSPTPETVTQYLSSPSRIAKINKAVNAFDNAVVYQAKIAGWWQPFDQFCSFSYTNPAAPIPAYKTFPWGYTMPFAPAIPGQDCELQHDPSYPGPSHNVEVAADLLIGANGQYAHYVGALADTAACIVNVTYTKGSPAPDVSVGLSFSWSDDSFNLTRVRAMRIDAKAIDCLNATRVTS